MVVVLVIWDGLAKCPVRFRFFRFDIVCGVTAKFHYKNFLDKNGRVGIPICLQIIGFFKLFYATETSP